MWVFALTLAFKLEIGLARADGTGPPKIHRVVPPPPPQNNFERWSLVYFIRPGFNNPLRPLSDKSNIIRAHAEKDPAMQALPKGETAGSWFQRRIKLQRAKNRTGPETWAQSRGTERESAVGLHTTPLPGGGPQWSGRLTHLSQMLPTSLELSFHPFCT